MLYAQRKIRLLLQIIFFPAVNKYINNSIFVRSEFTIAASVDLQITYYLLGSVQSYTKLASKY